LQTLQIGQEGSHKLFVYDNENNNLEINGLSEGYTLEPNELSVNLNINLGSSNNCEDSYFARIETTNNNQTVFSVAKEFSWAFEAQETNVPHPAQILCQEGSHKLFVYDNENNNLEINGLSEGYTLEPNELSVNLNINLGSSNNCGDSYFVRIETTNNNQTVFSVAKEFSWAFEDTSSLDTSDVEALKNKITYKLDIPCAIDRTQIIIPNPTDPNFDGQYKARCNSNAFFDELTGVYHFKRNEGYYLNLEITNDTIQKEIDLSQIESVDLEFYKNNDEVACFSRKMDSVYNEQNKYVSKITYVQPNESREFAQENMDGFVASCGINTPIYFKVIINLDNGERLIAQNTGLIKQIIIDSDNSNQIAQANRNKEQNKDLEQKRELTSNQKPVSDLEEPMTIQAISQNKPESQLVTKTAQIRKENNSEMVLNVGNSEKKIMPIEKILQEKKINSKKIVGEIVLDANSSNPEYVFEVKERKKIFGFIPNPFAKEKIVQKRISATLEINE